MPAAIPAIATLATTAITTGVISAAALTTAAVQVAIGFVASALSKPSSGGFSDFKSTGSTRTIRQAITEREVVYGEVRKAGAIVAAEVTNNNRYQHFVIVLADHEVEEIGEIIMGEESIPPDYLDASGNVIEGRYSGLIRIKKHLGGAGQVADPDLVAEFPGWDSTRVGNGVAYIYVRFEWDSDIFATGTPNISAYIRGKKVVDYTKYNFNQFLLTEGGENLTTEDGEYLITEGVPVDVSREYSSNIALIIADFLTTQKELNGLEVSQDDIDDAAVTSSANVSDEMIITAPVSEAIESADSTTGIITLDGEDSTLIFQRGDRVTVSGANLPSGLTAGEHYYVIPYQRKDVNRVLLADTLADSMAGIAVSIAGDGIGTITKVAEPRYHGGGIYKTSTEPLTVLEEMTSSMAGNVVIVGGKYFVKAGQYSTPIVSLGASDVASAIKVDTQITKQNRVNLVQGTYLDPINVDNPSDYPAVTNSTYEANDGQVLRRTLDLGYTKRSGTAQRIAKILLEKARQQIIFEASFKLTAFQLQVGDNFYFTFDRYGWDQKIFEVQAWELTVEDATPVIRMTARETAPEVYEWNSGEETIVDPAPNTQLPSAFNVQPVLGLSLDSVPVTTQGGDRTYKIRVSWQAPENQLVLKGGFFGVEFKLSSDSGWSDAGLIEGSATERDLFQASLDVLYDIRIRAINSIGVRSAYTTIENFSVGSTVVTDTEDWENELIAGRDGQDWEVDTLASEDWE